MKQPIRKGVDRQKAHATLAAAQRKKFAVAGLLLLVMAVLWVRIFWKKSGPTPAAAVTNTDAVNVEAIAPAKQKTTFIDLPFMAERHNVLANDFFMARGFIGLGAQGSSLPQGESSQLSGMEDQSGSLAATVEAMELTAIVNGVKPQAFIADRLLEEGQSFKFIFHDQTYKFRVVNISENKVELECNGTVITKKIPESFVRPEE